MKYQNIEIKWKGHSGFLIETDEGKRIYIDPFKLESFESADFILITHPHYDHCSLEDIKKIVKSGTIIVGSADIQSKIARLNESFEFRLIDVGQTVELDGLSIGGIPAYNKEKQFHPKSERWLGYLLKTGNTKIYHAGDTDLIPEMEKLNGKTNIALLPIGGTYTMNSEEAAEAASIINPEIVIPMHYNEVVGDVEDAEKFKKLCHEKGIKAEILNKE